MSNKEPKFKECGLPGCSNTFRQFSSLQKYCSAACQREGQEQKEKAKPKFSTIADLKNRFDVRRKETPVLLEQAKAEAQLWARLRDSEKPCISCGEEYQRPGDWHGGHCFKAEIYSGVELYEGNIHKQCKRCNIDLHGNKAGFIEGIVNRYGHLYFAELEGRANRTRFYVWESEELIEIKKAYRRKNKDYRKNNS